MRLLTLLLALSFFAITLLAAPPSRAADSTEYSLSTNHILLAATDVGDDDSDDDYDDDYYEDDEFDTPIKDIADPLEGFNRAMYKFNDVVFHSVIKPTAIGYAKIVPEPARRGVNRFMLNLTTPIRFVNSVLQLKIKRAGTELFRFGCNTTVGILGIFDPAFQHFGVTLKKEDTGQTLGVYGFGPGIYIHWPIIGPSSIRNTVGLVGDFFLDPRSYLFPHAEGASTGIQAYDRVNELSLDPEFLDELLADATDPYEHLRDTWHRYRENKVAN